MTKFEILSEILKNLSEHEAFKNAEPEFCPDWTGSL